MKTCARRLAVLAGIAVVSVGISTAAPTPAQASTHVSVHRVDTGWPCASDI